MVPTSRLFQRLLLARAPSRARSRASSRAPARALTVAAAALASLLALPEGAAVAGGTRSHDVQDFDDFDLGETDGAAIESSGKVTVGFSTRRSELEKTTSVFTCTPARKGDEVFIGTADPAAIYRVSPGKTKRAARKPTERDSGGDEDAKGKPAAELPVAKLAELPGVVVSAMTQLPSGELLAATLPGGVIHRIDRKGAVTEFAKLDVKQIWALVVDGNRLLVGTGPEGELYSMTLQGKDAKVILDVDEKNILSVQPVGGEVLVGTSPRAKLFQVQKDDLDGLLIHDFEGDEVRALAITGDGLLAAVNTFTDRGLSSLTALTKNLQRTSLVGQPPEGDSNKGGSSIKAKAKLYRVSLGTRPDPSRAAEATWEVWLNKSDQYFTSVVAADMAGTALVSSSYKGKIYRVRGRRDVATVADLEERQATGLCPLSMSQKDRRVIATAGDGAAVYELAPADYRVPAIYRSEVFDAEQPARYGALHVRGRGPFIVRARSGPSDEPDGRWSEWRVVKVTRDADTLHGRLNVPVRRYLQLEFALEDPVAELREFSQFYAPENLPPLVKSINVEPPSFDAEDDDEPSQKVTIKWKADALDDDELVYRVQVRPEGADEKQWLELGQDELVTKKEFKWEIDSVPDGTYVVGVTASDEPSNGTSHALTDQVVSHPFTIDRKRPTIERVSVKQRQVTGVARDEGSRVHDVMFSVDNGPFRAASPQDGLYDSKSEEFVLELPESLKPGRHTLVVRARDLFGNLGSVAQIIDL
ncbi:MAG: hypothetical protein H6713_06965 [Myxococcales bacterium]|nr:hypothetical protein [Myxococcales bacterium]MCB9749734.1 hypothetical protein [Myxococcales bacterium]